MAAWRAENAIGGPPGEACGYHDEDFWFRIWRQEGVVRYVIPVWGGLNCRGSVEGWVV